MPWDTMSPHLVRQWIQENSVDRSARCWLYFACLKHGELTGTNILCFLILKGQRDIRQIKSLFDVWPYLVVVDTQENGCILHICVTIIVPKSAEVTVKIIQI